MNLEKPVTMEETSIRSANSLASTAARDKYVSLLYALKRGTYLKVTSSSQCDGADLERTAQETTQAKPTGGAKNVPKF